MATKTRIELKAHFQNGKVPTAAQFADLIDSAVNKKDDNFFGEWQAGVAYQPGDVVISQKSLYCLLAGAEAPTQQTTTKKTTDQSAPTPAGSGQSYCSAKPPKEDPEHWQQLDFDIEDDDWDISPDGKFLFTKNQEWQVGVGTDCPEAKLHAREEERGQLQFNPDSTASRNNGRQDTELRIEAFNYPDCEAAPYLSARLDDGLTHLEANTEQGFSFEHIDPNIVNVQRQEPLQLLALARQGQQPQVGIGAPDPAGALHVRSEGVGEVVVNPEGAKRPTLQFTHQQTGAQHTLSLGKNAAEFATNAREGFRFRPANGQAVKSGAPTQRPVVSIDENGHLGVGTEQPRGNLEVLSEQCGALQAHLEPFNPSLAILNLKPTGRKTYFSFGADNAYAMLKTDAPCGFVFKKGGMLEAEEGNYPERNINEGTEQVYIDQNGKVGIGKTPDEYELDNAGSERAFETYLATNKKTIDFVKNIEQALDKVCRLTPIRFRWKPNMGAHLRKDEQFGLWDYEVCDVVPEVAKATNDGADVAIAYQSLVPLLIKAIQEQQELIDRLTKRVHRLEHGDHHPHHHPHSDAE